MASAQSRGWGVPPTPSSRIEDLWAPISRATFPQGVHKQTIRLMGTLLEITERRGYRCVVGWCWGYAPRKISGSNFWSNHAWGLAIDINAPRNPQSSRLVTDMPSWMPRLWEAHGFRWGGRYTTRPDAMHYEYIGTPSQVAGHLAKARKTLLTLTGIQSTTEEDMLKKGIPAPGQVWRMQRMINEFNTGDPNKGLTVDGDFGPVTEQAVNKLRHVWNHQPINGVWDMDLANRVQDHILNRRLAILKSDLINEIRAIPAGEKGNPGPPGIGLSLEDVRNLVDGARIEGMVRLS